MNQKMQTKNSDHNDFIEHYKRKSRSYLDKSNDSNATSNTLMQHLGGTLITATLSFLAIATLALGNQDILDNLSSFQKIDIFTAICIFVFSLAIGIIGIIISIYGANKMRFINGTISDELEYARSDDDLDKIEAEIMQARRYSDKNYGFGCMIAQAISFSIGLICVIVFAGSLYLQNLTDSCDNIDTHIKYSLKYELNTRSPI